MTDEKVKEVLTRYDRELEELGYSNDQFLSDDVKLRTQHGKSAVSSLGPMLGRSTFLGHCRWMCQQALAKFFDGPTKDVAKAMRWMCYVQGVANVFGIYSCNDLREHSRGGKDEFKTPAEEHNKSLDARYEEAIKTLAEWFDHNYRSVPEDRQEAWKHGFFEAIEDKICDADVSPAAEARGKVCQRCGTDLVYGLCSETVCPFHEHGQVCPLGWHNHPEKNIDGKKCECDHARTAVGRVVIAAQELLDHIDECDEDALLALDGDPHPPSTMSVLADGLDRELKKLE